MVFQKMLDYGFSGYKVPTTPQAPRSARRGATCQKIVKDNQTSAFDLLATVAGKLLQDNETSTTSSDTSSEKDQHGFVMEESLNKNKSLKAELSDEESCDRRYFSDHSSQAYDQNFSLKKISHPENDGHSGRASKVTSFSCSLVNGKNHNQMENLVSIVELDSSGSAEVSGCKLDDISEINYEQIGMGTDKCSFEGPLGEKPPALISSGGNAKLSRWDDNIPYSSLSENCDNISVVSRDDDENCFRCTHPSTKVKSFRPMTCIGDRRIRKILASKYWKLSSELKDDKLLDRDGNLKPIYHSRKNCYKRQRFEMNIPIKKRKVFDHHRSVSNSDGFIRSDGTCHSFEKGMILDASGSSPRICGDPGMSSLGAHQNTGLQCRDSHVKLRIKSFSVPELFIQIPETATIGSLKRRVMEAVTAILGGGLHVGVILRGKKVRDDYKTLIQTGISRDNQPDALGFILEPNSLKSLQPICAVDSPHVLHEDTLRYPSTSSPAVVHQRIQCSSDMVPEHQVTSLSNLIESDHDSAPSPINTSLDKSMTEFKAVITVPEKGMEALDVMPVPQKTKQSKVVQRRIRRPFSIAEVEALVQAVEKLGTGRWRDVKLSAFDDAEHRTYVDLKDKWKTLVHTARISPQQRRGQPVPQELLDRVLIAYHYWSHQQTKQHSADF